MTSKQNVFLTDSPPGVEVAQRAAATSTPDSTNVAFLLLWLFTFAIFGRPEDLLPSLDPFHLALVFGGCAGIAYLSALCFGRARLKWSRELSLTLSLTMWFILGVPFAYWRGGSFQVLTQTWLKTLLVFFLLSQTLTNIGRIRKILWVILLSELIASCASIVQQTRPELQEAGRLSGVNTVFLGWNYFGITASLTLPFIAFLYVSRRSVVKTAVLLVVVCSAMWMLVLTASRGGVLNILFSMLLTWWFLLRGSWRGRAVGILVAICMLIAAVKAPDVFWIRLQTIWNGSNATYDETSLAGSAEESTKGRGFLLAQSLKYTIQNPVFGVGLGNFPEYNAAHFHRPEAWFETHNTFTQLSSEAGIPALGLFLALLFGLGRRMKTLADKLKKDKANEELCLLAKATLVSILSFAFAGFFAHLAYEYLFYYIAGIGVALVSIGRTAGRVQCELAEPREELVAFNKTGVLKCG